MKRSKLPLKLHKSPLVMVLAQVRTSPVAKMSDYAAEVQERVRRRGFPRFAESSVQELLLTPGGPPQLRVHPRWEFQDKGQATGIILSQNGVVLHTRAYDTFDAFADHLALALEFVGEVVKPSLVERLGLRYVNLIRPQEGESWTSYVKHGLHGISDAAVGMRTSLHRSEIVGTTEVGQLVLRCFQASDGSFLPPDLVPSSLDHSSVLLRPEEVVTLLDLDHYSEVAREYDAAQVVDYMWRLHDNLELSFRECITDLARKHWKAEERTEASR
jgi:uncharacterized protein (TIGR04255 family)